jgi:hypothetical protein
MSETYDPHVGYTSCIIKVDPAKVAALRPTHLCTDTPFLGLFIPAGPSGERRWLGIQQIEGERREYLFATEWA